MWALPALLLACDPGASPPPPGDPAADSAGPGGSTDPGTDGGTPSDTAAPEDGEPVASTRADLRLKRWRQLSLDLEGALSLTADQVCKETGIYDCMTLTVVPLGGVSVENGVFEHPNTLQATTGLAIERVALQACYNRLQLDLEGEPVVFRHVDLGSDILDVAGAGDQVVELTRRLLARDPLQAELDALLALHGDALAEGGGNADWAVMTCFALATSTEALTY